MHLARAALGNDANLAAGRAAVFRGIVGRENLYLLSRIEIGNADAVAVGSGADPDGAVISDQVVLRTAAVDVEATGGKTEIVTSKRIAAADTGLGQSQKQRVAPVELQQFDLLQFDQFSYRGGFRLQGGNRRSHRHDFTHLADGQRHIHRGVDAGV